MTTRLSRTRQDLALFLRRKREALQPEAVGLPRSPRRRTPGLRREEVATIAGIELSWYTWLEQGREITVSAHMLDSLARALRMNAEERRHLYLLAQHRPPPVSPATACGMAPPIRRLLDDLSQPAFVMNLGWDVLGWNAAGDRLFGFSERPEGARNMLSMYFADDRLSRRVLDWEGQAPGIVASFRRDHAAGRDRPDMRALAERLEAASGQFRRLWRDHQVRGRCEGRRGFRHAGGDHAIYDHATLIVDEDRHLRLIYYTPSRDAGTGPERFAG